MPISTVPENPEAKREKLKLLKAFHQSTLDELGVSGAFFIPKMAYIPYGKSEKFLGFFLSEINRGEDAYIEFCSKEYVPEDPERTLYKWKFNPHFEDEYEKTEPTAGTGHVRYLIPVQELHVVKVNKPGETISETDSTNAQLQFDLPDPDDDLPMEQMTIRDYAAIHLGRPCSRKEFLNNIIKNGR